MALMVVVAVVGALEGMVEVSDPPIVIGVRAKPMAEAMVKRARTKKTAKSVLFDMRITAKSG